VVAPGCSTSTHAGHRFRSGSGMFRTNIKKESTA
jgi:hypothetical protein